MKRTDAPSRGTTSLSESRLSLVHAPIRRGIGVLALATTVIAWVLTVGQLGAHFDTLHQNATFQQPGFMPFFLGIGPILYSYGGASTLPTIQIDMMHREQFGYSVMLAYFGECDVGG